MKPIIETGQFEKCRQYITVVGEMRVIGQLVFIGTRIVIPSKLWPRTLALAHKSHLAVFGTKAHQTPNLRTKVWWPEMYKAVGRHFRACNGRQLVARPCRPPETIRSTSLPDGPCKT